MNMGSISVTLIGLCMIGMVGALEMAQCGSTTAVHMAVQVIGDNSNSNLNFYSCSCDLQHAPQRAMRYRTSQGYMHIVIKTYSRHIYS
jgi:hypothetical protein